MDCVEPGLQSRNTTVNLEIPVKEADDGAKIHWVDSGQVIVKDEKIKFNIGGSVNLCPRAGSGKSSQTLVPASFCKDGSVPNYSQISIFNDNNGIDENALCVAQGLGGNRRYVDTTIRVNPGDKLTFSLVSRKIKIDCDDLNLLKDKVTFDDYYILNGNKATPRDICKGGQFIAKSNGSNTMVNLEPLNKRKDKNGKSHIQEYEVLVGNGYTPYDNKVHFNKDHIQDEMLWINGALLDLRRAKTGLNKLCDKEEKSKGDSWVKRCGLDEVKKYSPYEINCYGQNICYNKQGLWNGNGKNCVSSIRYEKYDKSNKCDMYSYLEEMEKKIQEGNFSEGENISWAEALVAKISIPYLDGVPDGSRDDMQKTTKGTQCLPKSSGAKDNKVCSESNDNFEDFSLKLNHEYEVNNDVMPGSSVMLAIASDGNDLLHRGGYNVLVNRSCEFTNGQKLYMYLGDTPPKDLSTVSINDFKKVDLAKEDQDYLIDGSHLEGEESKKIYFGIDVSNVKKGEITDENGKYYENNKYTVNLFIKKKINDFVSSTVNKIFDFIMKGGDSSIKDPYESYRKGLLQGVRALLTLYVIFSVVGYMLGTVQLSKYDFIIRMVKIAFIAFAFSDKSWELFGTNLSKLFVGGSAYLIDSFSGYIVEGGKRFAFLDLTVGVLFTSETWLKFLSLMLSGPFGFMAFLLILEASFTFLTCMISAIVKYVIAAVLGAFLLSLTPLFIVFILFQQTKSLFDQWIKVLARVSIQPVILFSCLSLLNQLMYSVLYNLTNFSACYQCLISISFASNDFCLMKSMLPLGYSPGTSVDVALNNARSGGYFAALPIDLIQAFIYLILASVMEAFALGSESIAQAIFGVSHGIASGVRNVAYNASQALLSTVGLDNETQQMINKIKISSPKDRTEIDVKSSSNNHAPEKSEAQNNQSNASETVRNSGDVSKKDN
jgi:type IV secretion system protein VirB6